MANIFQRIAQGVKNQVGGAIAQIVPGGNNRQSYIDEQERRRRLQQQMAAQRAAQQIAQRRAAQSQQAPGPSRVQVQNNNQPSVKLNVSQPTPTPQAKVAVPQITPKIVVPTPNGPLRVGQSPTATDKPGQITPPKPIRTVAGTNIQVTNPLLNKVAAVGDKTRSLGRELAQGIVRTAPKIGSVGTGEDQALSAQSSTLEQLRKLPYEQRKRAIDDARRNPKNGLGVVLGKLGLDLNDPSDQKIDAIRGNVQKTIDSPNYTPGSRVEKFIFGKDGVKSTARVQAGDIAAAERAGFTKNASNTVGTLGAAGGLLLDITPGGSSKSKFAKQLAKEADPAVVARLLKSKGLNITDDEAKIAAQNIAATKSRKEVEQHLNTIVSKNDAIKEGVRIAGDEAGRRGTRTNQITSTPNDELVRMGLADRAITHVPVDRLRIGSDAVGDIDEKQVQHYIEDILASRDIDPVIASKNKDGIFDIQDGKHRAEAVRRLGIPNIPVSMQPVKDMAGKVADGLRLKPMNEAGSVRLPFGADKPDSIDNPVDHELARKIAEFKKRKLSGDADPQQIDAEIRNLESQLTTSATGKAAPIVQPSQQLPAKAPDQIPNPVNEVSSLPDSVPQPKPSDEFVESVTPVNTPRSGDEAIQALDSDMDQYVNGYTDMLKSMDSDAGVTIMPDGTRASSHTPFYRQYFAETGRAPSDAAWREEAIRQLDAGKADEFVQRDYDALRQQRAELHQSNIENQAMVDNPQIPEDVPVTAGAGKETDLGYLKSLKDNEELSPELKASLAGRAPATTNEARLANAQSLIETKGLEGAAAHVLERSTNYKNLTDQDVVDAQEVAKLLDQSGDDLYKAQATNILVDMAEQLRRAGQTVQAASLLNSRTPEGIKFGAVKTLGKNGIEVTPEIGAKIDARTADIREADNLIQQLNEQRVATQQAIEAASDPAELRGLHNQLIAFNKSIEAAEYARDLAVYKTKETVDAMLPTNIFKKGVAIWRAGLLTSPMTTAGNLTANGVENVIKKGFVDPVASMADAMQALFTGERTKTLTLRNQFSGNKEGIGQAVQYFKTGYDPRNATNKFDAQQVHFSDGPLGRAAELYTQGVLRTMSVADQPFWYGYLRNSLADQAIAAAKNAGIRGKDRTQFIKEFITNPAEDAMQIATNEANYGTFQNKTLLGDIASGIKQIASGDRGGVGTPLTGAAADFIIPFTQVPASLATRVIDRTPIGVAKEIVKQARKGEYDQRAMSNAIGNGAFGALVIGAGAALASNDMITLSYPSDAKERALWQMEGKQPFSVRIGDKWYSMNYIQPFGTHIAAGGAYAKAIAEGKSPIEAFSQASAIVGNALTEQSFLKGVNSLMDTVSDPERSFGKFAENTASGIVPNFIRASTRAADDVQREVDGIGDAVKQGIPGLRQTLPAKTDLLGNEMPRNTDAFNSLFNPLRPSNVRGDALTSELQRLQDTKFGVVPTELDDKIKFDGVEATLNGDQKRSLQLGISQKVKEAWDQIVASPDYQSKTDEEKSKILSSASGDIGAALRDQFASANKFGKYAPGFTGKPSKLTSKQEAIANGAFDPDNYVNSISSGKIAKDVSTTTKDILTRVDAMTKQDKNNYLKDPKNNYQYELSQFENDMKNGDLSQVDQYTKAQSLGQLKIKSAYTAEANELYGLSKTKLKDFTEKHPQKQSLINEVLAMDQELADNGYISKPKFGGSGGSGGGGSKSKEKTIRVPAPQFGSFSLINPPKSPTPAMNSVIDDFNKMIAGIKVLQGTQFAPGQDSSEIKIKV